MSVVDCDLSGFGVRFRGLPPALVARLRREWSPYVIESARFEPVLELQVEETGRPWVERAYDPKGMTSRLDVDLASFRMEEGEAEVRNEGPARVRLVAGTGERQWFTLLNLFRACLAWRLPSHGGALIHAAGIVVAGRGFALTGAAGAGKSTFARVAESGGARVVSDDVVLVDTAGPAIEIVAAPLRSTHAVEYCRERWPLAALLFPRHGNPPGLRPVGRLLAQAKLTANLPFVAEGVDRDPRIATVIERLVERCDCAELTFAPDPAFLNLLRDRS